MMKVATLEIYNYIDDIFYGTAVQLPHVHGACADVYWHHSLHGSELCSANASRIHQSRVIRGMFALTFSYFSNYCCKTAKKYTMTNHPFEKFINKGTVGAKKKEAIRQEKRKLKR